MPCDAVFADAEWQAVYLVTRRQPPPTEPPSLETMVRMVAGLGGFLNRKGDGPDLCLVLNPSGAVSGDRRHLESIAKTPVGGLPARKLRDTEVGFA